MSFFFFSEFQNFGAVYKIMHVCIPSILDFTTCNSLGLLLLMALLVAHIMLYISKILACKLALIQATPTLV